MKNISLLFLLLLLYTDFAIAHVVADCRQKPHMDHVSETACLTQLAGKASQKMNSAYNTLKKHIAAWDANPEERVAVLKTLEAAQHHYLLYKKSECEFEFSVALGGNGGSDMRLSCEIALDTARYELLRDQSDWFLH